MQWLRDNLGMIAKSADVGTLAETTALGAAYAVWYWKAVEDLRASWGKDHEWTPADAGQAAPSTVHQLEEGYDPHV